MKKFNLYTFLLIIGVMDFGVIYWICSHYRDIPNPTLIFFTSRLLLSVVIFFLVRFKRQGNTHSLLLIGFFVVMLQLVYSLIGIIAFVFVLEFYYDKKIKHGKLYHIDQEEGEIVDDNAQEPETISIEELKRVAPLIDGMTDDNKNNRIAAILAMEQMIDYPSIRNALMEAKNDPHKEVQYFANDALKKVTDKYMGEIKIQLDCINDNPPTFEAYKKLADLYAYLANANMDHPVMVKFYHNESVKYYTFLIENYPDSKIKILQKLIPALYQNNDYNKCLIIIEEVKDVPELSSLAILYKLRSLFKMRKMGAIKKIIASIDLTSIVSKDNLLNMG